MIQIMKSDVGSLKHGAYWETLAQLMEPAAA
jgi:hypothetical protein